MTNPASADCLPVRLTIRPGHRPEVVRELRVLDPKGWAPAWLALVGLAWAAVGAFLPALLERIAFLTNGARLSVDAANAVEAAAIVFGAIAAIHLVAAAGVLLHSPVVRGLAIVVAAAGSIGSAIILLVALLAWDAMPFVTDGDPAPLRIGFALLVAFIQFGYAVALGDLLGSSEVVRRRLADLTISGR
jgi:hypothetical protein